MWESVTSERCWLVHLMLKRGLPSVAPVGWLLPALSGPLELVALVSFSKYTLLDKREGTPCLLIMLLWMGDTGNMYKVIIA